MAADPARAPRVGLIGGGVIGGGWAARCVAERASTSRSSTRIPRRRASVGEVLENAERAWAG